MKGQVKDPRWLLACYWGSRPEDSVSCADRFAQFIARLSAALTSLGPWRPVSPHQLWPLPPLPTVESQAIEELMLRFRDRTDDTGDMMEDMGFSLTVASGKAWNVLTDLTEVSITCGSTSVPNHLIASLSEADGTRDRLLDADTMSMLLEGAMRTMDALWGVVTHPRVVSAAHPYLGWITYLKVAPDDLPPLPPPSYMKPIGRSEVLVITSPERFDPEREGDWEHCQEVERCLREAGVMKGIKYWS